MLSNPPQNMPVAREALRRGLVDTVVTDVASVSELHAFLLAERAVMPRAWFVPHPANADAWALPSALAIELSRVAQEVHLFPGVPVLTQCEALAAQRRPAFHLDETYRWELGAVPTVSGAEDDPLPFVRLMLPFSLDAHGACACGRTVFERRHEGARHS